MCSKCFDPEGSPSGRRLYVQVWSNLFICQRYKQSTYKTSLSLFYIYIYIYIYSFQGFETEMDALRRSARISILDRKTNDYIRGKMDVQDMILDDITRKQLIWYGHVERVDPTWLPEIMIDWKPEGRKKRGRPRRTWKDGIYTAMN